MIRAPGRDQLKAAGQTVPATDVEGKAVRSGRFGPGNIIETEALAVVPRRHLLTFLADGPLPPS